MVTHDGLLSQVLAPAIELAEGGFPVAPVAAHLWGGEAAYFEKKGQKLGQAMLQPDGSAPKAGQIQRNPDLARTFRSIAEKGTKQGLLLFCTFTENTWLQILHFLLERSCFAFITAS